MRKPTCLYAGLALALVYSPLVCSQQLVNTTIDDGYVFSLENRRDGIKYSENWKKNYTDTSHSNNSLHFTVQPGEFLIYFFQGNAIYYYGDYGFHHARANISLDTDQLTEQVFPYAPEIHPQQMIWYQKDLGPGDHYIKIRHAGPLNNRTTLDYFVIESDHGILPKTLGPAASDVPTEALFVDDTDLDQLSYSDVGWSTQGWVENFNNSLHLSDSTESYVTFKFNGTAVWYFASQGLDRGKLNVTLDGKQNWTVNGNWPVTVQQKLLWNITDLEYGEHTVVLTHIDSLGSYMGLDFFRYLPAAPPEKHKPPVGPIVGGVVGGLAFLVFICLGVLFYVHRYKPQEDREYSTRARPAPPPLLNSGQPSRGSAAEPYMTQPVDGLNSPRAANLPIRRKGLVNTPPLNHQIESSAGTTYITGGATSERTWPEGAYEESLPPAYQPAYRRASP